MSIQIYSPTLAVGPVWTDPMNILASDNAYAILAFGQIQYLIGMNYGIVGAGVINQVEVGVEQYDNLDMAPFASIDVSWDGGTSWSALAHPVTQKPADDNAVEWLDVTADTIWDWDKLSDVNFQARLLVNAKAATAGSYYVDWLPARITWTPGKARIRSNIYAPWLRYHRHG